MNALRCSVKTTKMRTPPAVNLESLVQEDFGPKLWKMNRNFVSLTSKMPAEISKHCGYMCDFSSCIADDMMDLIVKGPAQCVFYQRFNKYIFHFSNGLCVWYIFIILSLRWIWPCFLTTVWVFIAGVGGVNRTLHCRSFHRGESLAFNFLSRRHPTKRKPDPPEFTLDSRQHNCKLISCRITRIRWSCARGERLELEWTRIRE